MPSHVLGIDLGTTNSVVAYADAQRVRVLRDSAGHLTTPSIVAFPEVSAGAEFSAPLVGFGARERRLIDTENTVFSVKRLIGRPYRSAEVRRAAERLPFKLEEGPTGGVAVRVRGESFSLPEISSFILRELRQNAEQALGQPCVNAVITVPANFNELQRMATRDAGRIAGLNVLRILNEPTAAALAYGYRAQQQQRIAVYDFGGGTFDISILELSGDVIEVVATAGDTHLGGDDMDRALADRMLREFEAQHGIDLRGQPQQYARLVMAGEWLKCQLSEIDAAAATIRELATSKGRPIDLAFRTTREELHALCSPLIERTFAICEDALRLAGVRPSQLDGVILVGGQTRMPKVREMVSEYFGMEPQYTLDPDLAVAQGAALQGYALSGMPAAELARKPVRTLAGQGGAAGSPLESELEDLFEDEPTRVADHREELRAVAAARAGESSFDDDVATSISTLHQPHPSIRPEGAIGTHPSTLSGVGAPVTSPREAVKARRDSDPVTVSNDEEFVTATSDLLQLPPEVMPSTKTLAETPSAKAGVRPSRLPPEARALVEAAVSARKGPARSQAPAPKSAASSAPSGDGREDKKPTRSLRAPDPDIPAALRSEEAEAGGDPSTTLHERPNAKPKAPPPSAASPKISVPAPLGKTAALFTPAEPDLEIHVEEGSVAAPLPGLPGEVADELDAGEWVAEAPLLPRLELPQLRAPLLIGKDGARAGLPASNVAVARSQFPGPRSVAPLLLDVTPHTLCVETVGGFCETIIERNAPIPTEQTRVFSTSRDNQVTVSVRVCQGESRRTEENEVLGQIDLLELRRARRGEVNIAVTFEIDADGTLNARALDVGTGRGQEIQISLVGAIGTQEMERMRLRLRGVAS